ncbi:MAG: HigA family addiction module antidote protein [Candidatus Sumerlaeia bacterium]|nr:HigA family addiction module antidote protein [Candidatus Sumerlaeia bacterium]
MADTFTPDFAIHPGETLKESMGAISMNQVELAERTGLSRKTINGIIKGKESLTHETALQLEKVFRVPARFWINLQTNYEAAVLKQRERARLAPFRDWARERGIPYNELAKRGLVADTRDKIDRLTNLLHFFGVANPNAFDTIWHQRQRDFSFRKSEKINNHLGAIAAWIRQGELEAESITCAPYDRKRLQGALDELRSFSLLPPKEFQSRLQQRCADLGIALVYIPCIKGAPAYGVTHWVSPKRVIVQLSLRGKDDGNFWFTFFHELGHVLLHGKSPIFLEIEKGETNDQEEEANHFARDLLIPRESLERFLSTHNRRTINEQAIRFFADENAITPGVVVGRLQWEGVLPYNSHLNALKARFDFADN